MRDDGVNFTEGARRDSYLSLFRSYPRTWRVHMLGY